VVRPGRWFGAGCGTGRHCGCVLAFGVGAVKGADRAENVSVDFGGTTGVKKVPGCTPKLVKL